MAEFCSGGSCRLKRRTCQSASDGRHEGFHQGALLGAPQGDQRRLRCLGAAPGSLPGSGGAVTNLGPYSVSGSHRSPPDSLRDVRRRCEGHNDSVGRAVACPAAGGATSPSVPSRLCPSCRLSCHPTRIHYYRVDIYTYYVSAQVSCCLDK